jgi:hypothetical protein
MNRIASRVSSRRRGRMTAATGVRRVVEVLIAIDASFIYNQIENKAGRRSVTSGTRKLSRWW